MTKEPSKVALMEQGYRELSLLASKGLIEMDGVILDAMNATLALMLAVDSGQLAPRDIAESPFLTFKRTREETLDWLFAKFITWTRDCYPIHDDFLALQCFVGAISYQPSLDGDEKTNRILRDQEIQAVLREIAEKMKERSEESVRLELGLIKKSLGNVEQALSLPRAHLFF